MTVFDDVIGHDAIVDMLQAESGRPAQTYLFVGPAGVGKATIARRFAAAVMCDGENCRRRVIGGIHPDLVLVEPEGRTALTVDQARATVSHAVLSPVEASRKIFLFEEADLLNDEAANTLLKTLEEPTASTTFILVARSEDAVLPTIASRARTIQFGRVDDRRIIEGLLARGVPAEQAEQSARTAGGRPGLALVMATRPDVASFRRAWLSVPGKVDKRPGTAFVLAKEMEAAAEPLLEAIRDRHEAELERLEGNRSAKEQYERKVKRAQTALHVTGLEILASWYRDAAAAQFGGRARNTDVAGADFTAVSPPAAIAAADRVLGAIASLETNQRPELAFAALFADLASAS